MDDYDYKQFTKGDYTKLEKDDYNYDYSAITVSWLRLQSRLHLQCAEYNYD